LGRRATEKEKNIYTLYSIYDTKRGIPHIVSYIVYIYIYIYIHIYIYRERERERERQRGVLCKDAVSC